MLRRKLLIVLGPMVALLALTAVAAVWSMQRLLGELDHVNTHAWQVVEKVNELSAQTTEIELRLHRIVSGEERHLDELIEAVSAARLTADRLSESYVLREPQAAALLATIRRRLPEMQRDVGAIATTEDPGLRQQRLGAFLQGAVHLCGETIPLSRHVRAHAKSEQDALLARFRHVLLAMTLLFLIVINVSVMLLIRTAGMILRPVGKLVESTRELGRENLAHRVSIPQRDEFGELAGALNDLAVRLSENEQRRMEVLRQAARTLNHELNNCIAIIQLQLRLMQRRAGQEPEMETRLREIHGSMERMTRTLAALLQVRRIVLTDYTPGVKMLDLEASVQPAEPLLDPAPEHV
jgi:signal transduction histidine kinase